MPEGAFFERHTTRSDKDIYDTDSIPAEEDFESEDYPGITNLGIERIKQRLPEMEEIIDKASPNAVIYLGGTSEENRTRSTAEALGDFLAEHYAGRDDILVVTYFQVEEMMKSSGIDHATELAVNVITSNPDKKIVFCRPTFLKEFSLRPHFRKPITGEHTDFSKQLYAKAKGDEAEATHIFMREDKLDDKHVSPTTPQKLALQHIQGIHRLQNFAHCYAGNREVMVGVFGHAWNLDALASYLANKGQANYDGFLKTGGQEITQSEIGKIDIKDNAATFSYRGQEYPIPPEILEPKES